jgi:hypothetical protein
MPYHQHDSESSIYLGSEEKNHLKYDFYYAPQNGSPTVIARFGEYGDYISGLFAIKSIVDKNKDIYEQLNLIKNNDSEDMSVLAKATILSIEKGLLTLELKPNERNYCIASLEQNLNRIFNFVKYDESFYKMVKSDFNTYRNHYENIEDCSNIIEKNYREHIINRYTGSSSSGYAHVTAEDIKLEEKVWLFAEKNQEHWFLMTEKIKHTDNSSNIFTAEGFSFIDSFIHNGIYDDWTLCIAKKDNDIVFIHDIEQENTEYKQAGYDIVKLNSQTILDTLKSIEDNKFKNIKKLKNQ